MENEEHGNPDAAGQDNLDEVTTPLDTTATPDEEFVTNGEVPSADGRKTEDVGKVETLPVIPPYSGVTVEDIEKLVELEAKTGGEFAYRVMGSVTDTLEELEKEDPNHPLIIHYYKVWREAHKGLSVKQMRIINPLDPGVAEVVDGIVSGKYDGD